MPNKKTALTSLFLGSLVLFVFLTAAKPSIAASKEKVLHSFCYDSSTCFDAAYPYAGLILDSDGNLYGTTTNGGSYDGGAVFELSPGPLGKWREKLLHSFGNGKDGYIPFAGLVFDSSGNLYSTTGGRVKGESSGTVFELSPNSDGKWTERVLHSFNGNDGANPAAGLILVTGGNLYGTTQNGGTYSDGTVFELSPGTNGKWTERVLHSFSNNGKDGTNPEGGVIVDSSGNLYGTTRSGGAHGSGTVFEITP